MSATHPASEGATKRRFPLDAAGFERLLTAAWVIQTQRDLELSPSEYEGLEHAFSSYSTQAPKDLPSSEPNRSKGIIANPPEPEGAAIATPVLKLPPSRVTVVRPPSEVHGSLALLPETGRHGEVDPNSFHFVAVSGSSGLQRDNRVEGPNKVLPFVRSNVRVRLTQSRVSFSVARFAAGVVALFVLLAFLLLEWRNHTGPTSVNASGPSTGAISASPIRPIPSVANPPKPELSHLRVTDDSTFLELGDLSPYELRLTRRQAEFGDDKAAFVLGMAYETGHGLSQNCAQAAHWVLIAAQNGDPAAEYNLALRYLNGDGVAIDQSQAKIWLKKAIRRGNAQARHVLDQLGS